MVSILPFFSIVGALSGEIMGLFADFRKKGIFEKSLNANFICLLPKIAGQQDINKFRPINLVGSVYKVLAKSIAF